MILVEQGRNDLHVVTVMVITAIISGWCIEQKLEWLDILVPDYPGYPGMLVIKWV